jgi:hypothetical protein
MTFLFNFSSDKQRLFMKNSECIFKLSDTDEVNGKEILLDGFGGVILK